MTFLVWYLHGSSSGMNSTQHIESSRFFSLMIRTCLPWGWALFVAASRLVDHWHHPSDVLAGLGLGFATCTIAYHHWYPPVWSPYAGIPRALLVNKTTNPLDGPSTDLHSISKASMVTTASTKRRQLQTQTKDDAVWYFEFSELNLENTSSWKSDISKLCDSSICLHISQHISQQLLKWPSLAIDYTQRNKFENLKSYKKNWSKETFYEDAYITKNADGLQLEGGRSKASCAKLSALELSDKE